MGVNFTPYDINKFLSQYVQDPSVQKQLSQQGAVVNPLFNDQLKTISLDFIRMLHEESTKLTSCHHALIPDPDVIGWNAEIGLSGSLNNRITVRTSSAGTVVNIMMDGGMFERDSMYGNSYEPHEGKPDHVYDIVGLLTTGFSTVNPLKHPWGVWQGSYYSEVGGYHGESIMPHRVGPQWGFEARPFVEDIKTAFENKWSQWGATVTTLPKNWH